MPAYNLGWLRATKERLDLLGTDEAIADSHVLADFIETIPMSKWGAFSTCMIDVSGRVEAVLSRWTEGKLHLAEIRSKEQSVRG